MNEHTSNSVITVTVAGGNIEQEIDQEIDQAPSKQATKANTTCCGIQQFSSFPTCWKHSGNNFEHVEEEQVINVSYTNIEAFILNCQSGRLGSHS